MKKLLGLIALLLLTAPVVSAVELDIKEEPFDEQDLQELYLRQTCVPVPCGPPCQPETIPPEIDGRKCIDPSENEIKPWRNRITDPTLFDKP